MSFMAAVASLFTVAAVFGALRLFRFWTRSLGMRDSKLPRPLRDYKYVIDFKRPNSSELKKTPYGTGIFCTRDVKKGELLFHGKSLLIPDQTGLVLLRDGDWFVELHIVTHAVMRHNSGMREVYQWDSFTNHSCDPTSLVVWLNEEETEYDIIATRDLKKGEQVTGDYETWEWDCKDKGIESCQCGSSKCRGRIWGYKFIEDRDLKVELYPQLWPTRAATFHKEEPELAAAIQRESQQRQTQA